MSEMKVALVGAGSMGSNHARVVSQQQRARLTHVVEPVEATGRALAERFDALWVPELPELDDLDAVIVAAATEAHPDLAGRVLGAGTPLLLEKPLAADLAASERIVELAARADVPLMCGLLERFNPAVMTARSIAESPFHVTATRHSPYTPRIRTGVGWDLLIHDADLALGLIGSDLTSATGARTFVHREVPDAEDVAEALLTFESGAVAQLSASRVGQRKVRQLVIYENSRMIEVDLLRRDVTVFHHVSEELDDSRGYRQQTVIDIPELLRGEEPLSAQFSAFLDLIEGRRDVAAERNSILPAHRVVAAVLAA